MGDERKYTERELREHQQLAYVQGWHDVRVADRDSRAREWALRNYPYPKRTQPRVVGGSHIQYKHESDVIWRRRRRNGGSWGAWESIMRACHAATILASPTEEVDGD